MTSGYSLGPDGFFRHGGRRFIPFGANWWPGSCGVELWQAWPVDEIRADLDLMRSLGMNCVRFFLRWQDFEPEPGRYDERCLARLAELLGWCRERGLAAHPALFVGWMSGAIMWPAWRAGRNVFADPFMVERGRAFARRVAAALAPFADTILAVDQGNELCCLPDSGQASPAAVAAWCAAINAAVREDYPGALMISGNEHNQVISDSGWRLGAQPGCDLLSMHAYPVPTWHPLGFDGLTDPLAQELLPCYVACARAFAPVLVQEFGTIVTFGTGQQDAYLRAILPACWDAGANGFLWWCLRDIRAAVVPYVVNGFEGTLGLVDEAGKIKPGLESFLEFGRSLTERAAPTRDARVALYWPDAWYPRDNPECPGNSPGDNARRLLIAHHLLRRLGHRPVVARRCDLGAVHTLVVAGAHLRTDEAAALADWVEAGGRLLVHGVDPVNWGPDYVRLFGAKPVDYRGPKPLAIAFAGDTWEMTNWPRGLRCELVAQAAEVLARDQDGLPALLRHRLGAGAVVFTGALVDDMPARVASDRAARDRWTAWYRAVLAALAAPAR